MNDRRKLLSRSCPSEREELIRATEIAIDSIKQNTGPTSISRSTHKILGNLANTQWNNFVGKADSILTRKAFNNIVGSLKTQVAGDLLERLMCTFNAYAAITEPIRSPNDVTLDENCHEELEILGVTTNDLVHMEGALVASQVIDRLHGEQKFRAAVDYSMFLARETLRSSAKVHVPMIDKVRIASFLLQKGAYSAFQGDLLNEHKYIVLLQKTYANDHSDSYVIMNANTGMHQLHESMMRKGTGGNIRKTYAEDVSYAEQALIAFLAFARDERFLGMPYQAGILGNAALEMQLKGAPITARMKSVDRSLVDLISEDIEMSLQAGHHEQAARLQLGLCRGYATRASSSGDSPTPTDRDISEFYQSLVASDVIRGKSGRQNTVEAKRYMVEAIMLEKLGHVILAMEKLGAASNIYETAGAIERRNQARRLIQNIGK